MVGGELAVTVVDVLSIIDVADYGWDFQCSKSTFDSLEASLLEGCVDLWATDMITTKIRLQFFHRDNYY